MFTGKVIFTWKGEGRLPWGNVQWGFMGKVAFGESLAGRCAGSGLWSWGDGVPERRRSGVEHTSAHLLSMPTSLLNYSSFPSLCPHIHPLSSSFLRPTWKCAWAPNPLFLSLQPCLGVPIFFKFTITFRMAFPRPTAGARSVLGTYFCFSPTYILCSLGLLVLLVVPRKTPMERRPPEYVLWEPRKIWAVISSALPSTQRCVTNLCWAFGHVNGSVPERTKFSMFLPSAHAAMCSL